MIFSLFSRVMVKVGQDEAHLYDADRLMYTEVAEIEKVTGLSYMEWRVELDRFKMTAVAALLHVLRKRDGQQSDFVTMQFNVAEFDVVPLKADDTEMTPAEWKADLARRQAEAAAAANPTPGANDRAPLPAAEILTTGTSPVSPNGTASARGNGTSSHGATSRSSKRTPTPA